VSPEGALVALGSTYCTVTVLCFMFSALSVKGRQAERVPGSLAGWPPPEELPPSLVLASCSIPTKNSNTQKCERRKGKEKKKRV